MADGVTLIESEIEQLAGLLASGPWSGAKMGLCTSNFTPAPTDVLATFTAGEPTVSGYARQNLTGWSTPTLDGSNRAVSEADLVTFLNMDSIPTGTIYVWFFVDSGGTLALMGGRFAIPFVLPATTGSYPTTPFARLRYE